MNNSFFKILFENNDIAIPKLDSNGGFSISLDNNIDIYIRSDDKKDKSITITSELLDIDEGLVQRDLLIDLLCAQYSNQQPEGVFFGVDNARESILLFKEVDLLLGSYDEILEQLIIFAKTTKYWQQKLQQEEKENFVPVLEKTSLNKFNLMNFA
ncbi:hypothetical protein [uncultured Shewanella sp.]|uniref:hypothetical protein n=1 Tax=uncultured Shewanella sp. TaxID=173975 RepID=UPI002614718D|nr:hypothetical protein [uncultured Shewanella sp.]